MSALSPKALAVLQKGRAGLRPAPGERERIEALLDARLATGAPSLSPVATRPLLTNGWRASFVGALGVGLVGGAAWLSLRAPADPVARPRPAPSVAALPEPSALPSASVEPPAVEAAPRTPAVVREAATIAPRPQDSLSREVALLSRATSALRAGRADEALKLLDEHQRQFPGGALSVERHAARGQALCSLMRIEEGRAELARLSPQSPAAGRTKQVCDAAALR